MHLSRGSMCKRWEDDNGAFVSGLLQNAVVHHSSWSFTKRNDQPTVYYLEHNEPMYGQALQMYLPQSYGDIVATDWHLVADALMGSPEKVNRAGRLMENLTSPDNDAEGRTQTLLHLVTDTRDFADDLISNMGYSPVGLSEWDKAMTMQNFISDNGSGSFANLFTERVRDFDPSPFWENMLKDPVVLRQDLLENYRPVADALIESLADRVDGNNGPLVGYLADWMDNNDPYTFLGQFSPESKLNVIYETDKSVFLQEYLSNHGVADISGAIQQIPVLRLFHSAAGL
jgi:hypothetical protein